MIRLEFTATALALQIYCLAALGATAGPSIEIAETGYDFGEVRGNQVITHTFRIRNRGNAPLRISGIKSSCGCTSGRIDPNPAPPGESADIEVVFNLHGRSGPQAQHVILNTNDPDTPSVRFRISGTVIPVVQFEPSFVSFGRLDGDRPASLPLKVSVLADLNVEFEGLIEGGEKFKIEKLENRHEAVAGRTVISYRVTVGPGLPPGRHRGTAVFRIGSRNSDSDTYDVTLSAWIMDSLLVAPRQLRIREGAQDLKRFIRITPGTVKDFSIESVRAPAPGITIVHERMEDGSHLFRIEGLHGARELHGRTIEIETDVPEMSTIEIPMHVFSIE